MVDLPLPVAPTTASVLPPAGRAQQDQCRLWRMPGPRAAGTARIAKAWS